MAVSIFKHVMMKSRYNYHAHIFANYEVLLAMEKCGGAITYTAVKILRTLEREYWLYACDFNKKWFKSILPLILDLNHAAKRIKAFVMIFIELDLILKERRVILTIS
jgi:hypothetical protein